MDQQVSRMCQELAVIRKNLEGLTRASAEYSRQIRDAVARYEGHRAELLRVEPNLGERVPTLKSLADSALGDGYVRELAIAEIQKALSNFDEHPMTMRDGSVVSFVITGIKPPPDPPPTEDAKPA